MLNAYLEKRGLAEGRKCKSLSPLLLSLLLSEQES